MDYKYIALVAKEDGVAASVLAKDNLTPKYFYYEADKNDYHQKLYTTAYQILKNCLVKKYDIAFYTTDSLVIKTLMLLKALKSNNKLEAQVFAEQFYIKQRQKLNMTLEEKLNLEREKISITEYFNAVIDMHNSGLTFNISKASEIDQVIITVPEGIELHEGDLLSFKNNYGALLEKQPDGKFKLSGKVKGLTTNWYKFTRDFVTVCSKIVTDHNGKPKKEYFIYKNMQSELGKAKSAMVKQLWILINEKAKEKELAANN